ncbi:NlpC/P60 family protein [Pseudonocardia sp. Ae707_Ps2]|uniref:NlpC/P60 family protein n=1 Tax=Pseudonocardia sp. Ae707_Ps2 TaxID=2212992 RepID=UPI003FD29F4F
MWGGQGPAGFGLLRAHARLLGHRRASRCPPGRSPRNTPGHRYPSTNIAPGDLVFIPGSLGTPDNPRHNGMYVGHGMIVNAYDTTRGVILQPLTEWESDITHIRRVHAAPPAGAAAPAGVPASAAGAS